MLIVIILNRKRPVWQWKRQTVYDKVLIYYTTFSIIKSITTSNYKMGEGGDSNSVFLGLRFSLFNVSLTITASCTFLIQNLPHFKFIVLQQKFIWGFHCSMETWHWEGNSCSASPQIPSIWLNKCQESTTGSILNQMNPVYTLPTYFCKIQFHIILTSMLRSFKRSLSFRLSYQSFVCISLLYISSSMIKSL